MIAGSELFYRWYHRAMEPQENNKTGAQRREAGAGACDPAGHRQELRFVVLLHEASAGPDSPPHWDFIVELEPGAQRLATWRLGRWAGLAGDGPITIEAQRLADHRRAYLDYEGPVAGNLGRVVRVEGGTLAVRAVSAEEVAVVLHTEPGECPAVGRQIDGPRWEWTFGVVHQ